jgi:hypothetical protein
MPFWFAPLLEFLGKLVTGEIYQLWKQGKLKPDTNPNVSAASNPTDNAEKQNWRR